MPIWTAILGLGVFFYVLLDGFDLGVGILYGFAPDLASRNLVMNSIAPIWDGNETWLVLGGLGLLAAFPLAFAVILPAVYFPILAMLLALIFRGVAFEFRFRDAERRSFWDHAFCYGSAIAAFAQGVVLGAFIQGFHVEGRQFAGGSFDFLTPFSLFTGLALMFGYSLLGAGWLVLKTEGDLQRWARRLGRRVSDRRAGGDRRRQRLDAADERRHRQPLVLLAQHRLPVAGAGRSPRWSPRANGARSRAETEAWPFAGAVGLFALSYVGIAISLWPMIAPPQHHLVAGRVVAEHPGVPAGRHAVPAADHPHVHRLVVLGVPRQGARRHRLSLSGRAGPCAAAGRAANPARAASPWPP